MKPDSYTFIMNHTQFAEALARTSEFLAQAIPHPATAHRHTQHDRDHHHTKPRHRKTTPKPK